MRIIRALLLVAIVLASGTAEAARDCNATNNQDEIAQSFIGRCCKGSIRAEFPGQWLSRLIGEVRKAADAGDKTARTAWKLLNKGEYKKAASTSSATTSRPPALLLSGSRPIN